MKHFFTFCIFTLIFSCGKSWFNDPGKIRINDIRAITLHQGQWTTGRRNPSVPQLKCVGGTAGCLKSIPTVVQCKNVGSDGYDVQWECKADIDSSYRFGNIQVSCEGYDYPEDEFILKGSCGLEYTIDYTETGRARSSAYDDSQHGNYHRKTSNGTLWKLLFFLICAYIIYTKSIISRLWKYFNRRRTCQSNRPYNNDNSKYSGESRTEENRPPSYEEATFSDSTQRSSSSNTNRSGFWSGLSLGGILGYLFTPRNNHHWSAYPCYHDGWNHRPYQRRWWGSPSSQSFSWFRSSSSRNSGSSSISSRTCSGFGGTSRR